MKAKISFGEHLTDPLSKRRIADPEKPYLFISFENRFKRSMQSANDFCQKVLCKPYQFDGLCSLYTRSRLNVL